MERVRLALIGAGGMANAMHYPSLAEMPDVEMAALCDLNEERLQKAGQRFGIHRRYTDYRRMLDAEECDAVYILMPPHQLFDVVMDVIERGKHVYIEKPPGITADQTRHMAEAAQRRGVLTMVAFNRRFIPLMRKVKALVEERGPVTQCLAAFYKHFTGPYYRGAVDVLTSDGIHAVDMLRWMGGEVAQVASDVQCCGTRYANMFNALLRFKNGAVGTLLGNWNVGARRHFFEMHAVGISAYCDPNDRALVYADNNPEPRVMTTQEAAGSEENRVFYGFAAENRHFVECVKTGTEPETNFEDAVKTMELVERIYASAW